MIKAKEQQQSQGMTLPSLAVVPARTPNPSMRMGAGSTLPLIELEHYHVTNSNGQWLLLKVCGVYETAPEAMYAMFHPEEGQGA